MYPLFDNKIPHLWKGLEAGFSQNTLQGNTVSVLSPFPCIKYFLICDLQELVPLPISWEFIIFKA